MEYYIAPSILSADLARLGEDVQNVLNSGADIVHFDVMDNHYVPNLTFGASICKALRDYGITAPIDVHLMVSPVERLIVDFAKAGASMISFHPEATHHLDRNLSLIRELGCQSGVVLNPATPLHHLDHIMDRLDFILLMSVNPGFGGQSFIPETLNKLRLVKQRIEQYSAEKENAHLIRLSVDGGVGINNIAQIAQAGADTFVAGSAIFGQSDYKVVIDQMRVALNRSKNQ